MSWCAPPAWRWRWRSTTRVRHRRAARVPPTRPLPPRTRPLRSRPARATSRRRSSRASRREPLSFALLGEAVLDGGALPGPAPGLGGAVGVRAARWSASGFGLLLPARSTTAGNGGRAEFALLAAGVRGCYALAAWSVRPSACVGIELGRVSAAGVGLAGAASFGDAWLGSSAGAELRAELGASWFWAARGEAVVPIFRERYFVDAGDWVHRAALPGFRLALGVGVELR
jgi:hypothetical protein